MTEPAAGRPDWSRNAAVLMEIEEGLGRRAHGSSACAADVLASEREARSECADDEPTA